MAFVVTACTNSPEAHVLHEEGVAIAVLPSATYNAAENYGVFTVDNGCVVLTVRGMGRLTPVFSTDIAIGADRSNGRYVLPLETPVTFGGSAMLQANDSLSDEFRRDCPGPYFAVGPISTDPPAEPAIPSPGPLP